uniref:Uncharacterized protein n=1 Tax=Rhizophora mucronata TaxID=61149 RepID=A0A2P2N156_RHIMU
MLTAKCNGVLPSLSLESNGTHPLFTKSKTSSERPNATATCKAFQPLDFHFESTPWNPTRSVFSRASIFNPASSSKFTIFSGSANSVATRMSDSASLCDNSSSTVFCLLSMFLTESISPQATAWWRRRGPTKATLSLKSCVDPSGRVENHELTDSELVESKELDVTGAVLIRKRSDGERGKVGGRWVWGLRTIWKVAWDRGEISPLGGLTRNFWGEEVLTLKAIGAMAQSDLRHTSALHLQLS